MGFTLVVANAQRKDITDQVKDRGEMVVFNEGSAALHRGMDALPGWGAWIPTPGAGINCVMWQRSEIALKPISTATVTVGGRIGLSRVLPKKYRRDRRRLGPSRRVHSARFTDADALRQLTIMASTGRGAPPEQVTGIIHFTHLPARTQTKERWRWPVMISTIRNLRRHMYAVRKEHPGLPEIFCGDTNLRRVPRVFLGVGWKRVKLPPDLGGNRYTQVWYRQAKGRRKIVVTPLGKFATRADHDAVRVNVRFGGLA